VVIIIIIIIAIIFSDDSGIDAQDEQGLDDRRQCDLP
jgi:hypothetical protein